MRTKMKWPLLGLLFSLFALNANAQPSSVTTFTAKAYAKTLAVMAATEDTSATVSIGSYPWVSVSTVSTGSDSTPMTVKIDGFVNGVWSNNMTSQVLTVGRPTGYTLASTKGQVANFFIRTNYAADATQNVQRIRIRNVHANFANGSTDSTSALTYTQSVILRK